MTGNSTSRTFIDFDCRRNQEWLRRRKLRLEQVRKQSDEIAKTLRQKVINDEKVRLEEYGRISEAKLKNWKHEKLDELERKLRCALEKFGEGYKESEAELVPEAVIEERYKINLAKAQKRGEIAKQEELKKKKLAEDKKASFIQRKIMTRKREDLRSALVRSIPLKKQLTDSQGVCEKNEFAGKVTVKGLKKKKLIPHKSCSCNQRPTFLETCNSKDDETVWINLNDVKTNSSAGDSETEPRSSKSSANIGKIQKEKPDGTVEFYDFSSRYRCKSFKEFPHLVEKIDPEPQMLNANKLAEIEAEKERKEMSKKTVAKSVSQERGKEALQREKIKREYNNLINKLEELSKKEKMLKTQQRIPLGFLHMNSERLSEKMRTKQRIMESEFERIYFEATARVPETELSQPLPTFSQKEDGRGAGDYVRLDDSTSVKLSFSPANLKPNSRVTSEEEEVPADSSKKVRKRKKRRQLLLDIDKALKEGRKLRKTIYRNQEAKTSDDEEEKSSSDSKTIEIKSVDSPPLKNDVAETKNEELQSEMENVKETENSAKESYLKEIDKAGDDSLPVSSSTSYKSPPSVIRSYRLQRILDYLEVNKVEDNDRLESNAAFKKNVEKLLHDLVCVENCSKSEEKNKISCASPTLEYYIEKLLNMSRECIANLSVTSENVSTPNITDLDVKDEKVPETKCFCEGSFKEEDLMRKSKLEKADHLGETINWRKIFEKNSKELRSKPEDLPDGFQPEFVEDEAPTEKKDDETVNKNSEIKNKYEEITKKCSERISELSKMLDKVRRDKENLLSSTSGSSNLSFYKDGGGLNKGFDTDEERESISGKLTSSSNKVKTSPVLEDFISRYNLVRPRNETLSTAAVADSQSLQDPEESLESWPDVMDELLRKKILTSPFKWSDGNHSSDIVSVENNHTEPSSIKTVIGNFRKEISKIKPSLFDSAQQSNVSVKPRHDVDEKYGLFRRPNFGSFHHWAAAECESTQKENSIESINHALTSLGLNWAKNFLRKNQESRAMSSSSNSEEKCPEDEEDSIHSE